MMAEGIKMSCVQQKEWRWSPFMQPYYPMIFDQLYAGILFGEYKSKREICSIYGLHEKLFLSSWIAFDIESYLLHRL